MPHPISLQCGEDKKLSGAYEVAAERQEGIPRAMGASESRALCELLSLFFLFADTSSERWKRRENGIILSCPSGHDGQSKFAVSRSSVLFFQPLCLTFQTK